MASCLFNDRLVEEDQHLTLNRRVEVHWTDSGYCYQGTGRIVSLNRHEATVSLTTVNGHDSRFRAGSKVCVPRYHDQTRWSDSTCVKPL